MNESIQLLPNETIVLRFRKHGIMLFFDTIGTLLAMFVPFVFFSILSSLGYVPEFLKVPEIIAFASAAWLLIVCCALAIEWTDYYLDLWIVTDSRVINIAQIGLFNRNISSWGIERIQEITIHTENVVQSFFNYGTLQIQTSGPSDEYAKAIGVPNPERVRSVIMAQIDHVGTLKRINENQTSLLRTVSHEVKGYLAHDAAALAQIVDESSAHKAQSLEAFARRALGETRKGVASVMGLLGDSNIQTGAIQMNSESIDLKPLVTKLVEEYRSSAESKKILLRLSVGNNPCSIQGDTLKLRNLVFRNLIDNAFHYTEKGSIQVALSSDGLSVRFTVTDTGIGISREDMVRLFAPGAHGLHSLDINPESTGFGLSSARAVVDAHHGKLWAESDGPQMGSTFVVELPADKKTVYPIR